MASANDVAAYLLEKLGTISAMRMQKLLYFSQAYCMAWTDKPLFEDDFEAWAYGPVIPQLYWKHRGQLLVDSWGWGDASQLTDEQSEVVDDILKHYGKYSAAQLSDLTHRGSPWRNARKGIPDGQRGNEVITKSSMMAYYSHPQLDG